MPSPVLGPEVDRLIDGGQAARQDPRLEIDRPTRGAAEGDEPLVAGRTGAGRILEPGREVVPVVHLPLCDEPVARHGDQRSAQRRRARPGAGAMNPDEVRRGDHAPAALDSRAGLERRAALVDLRLVLVHECAGCDGPGSRLEVAGSG